MLDDTDVIVLAPSALTGSSRHRNVSTDFEETPLSFMRTKCGRDSTDGSPSESSLARAAADPAIGLGAPLRRNCTRIGVSKAPQPVYPTENFFFVLSYLTLSHVRDDPRTLACAGTDTRDTNVFNSPVDAPSAATTRPEKNISTRYLTSLIRSALLP